MSKNYILAIDQGTTGSRVLIFNHNGEIISNAYREIRQIFPNPGWVEHDPDDYLSSIKMCAKEAIEKSGLNIKEIEAIGITNQRETTILWDRETGKPLYNAIVWQCRRTSDYCNKLKSEGHEKVIREKTGLFIDAYFSASKIKWIIDNVSGIREKVKMGKVCMGNVDSWIIWNLSNGKYHVTDYSNASRTMLLNIHTLKWDNYLLDLFGISKNILPEVMPTSGVMAYTGKNSFFGREIPIAGVAGDQQSALFGQGCFKRGMAKNTYGTALALMLNIGDKPVVSNNGLTTDLAWVINKKATYSLEGVVFIGGAAIQWLRDGLKIISEAGECDTLSKKVPDTGNVYLVPAFTGLCAPYWDMYARGIIIGITRGTTQEHICRAAEESIAYQTKDVIDAMSADSGDSLKSLHVDGGATRSDFLMQFQADILGIPVEKPKMTEMAALGAAYLAGLGVGFWDNIEELEKHWVLEKRYEPSMESSRREELYNGWKKAVKRSFDWARQDS
ncbi:MAG: glycerol kinase GlpK [Actinobacteria bacterium]|nr:glycerol kinase GlpK [Actinomycetota bacterium]